MTKYLFGTFRFSTQSGVYYNATSDGEYHNGVLANDVGPQCADYCHVNSMRRGTSRIKRSCFKK